MGEDANLEIEITPFSSAQPLSSLAFEANAAALMDTGRYPYLQGLGLGNTTGTATAPAKSPAHKAAALAFRAGGGRGQGYGLAKPVVGFLQTQFNSTLYVLPPDRSTVVSGSPALTAWLRAKKAGKELAETLQVLRVYITAAIENPITKTGGIHPLAVFPVGAQAVIESFFFRITEYFIGLINLFDFFFGFLPLFTVMQIRVPLAGQLALGRLYLFGVGIALDTQDFVIIKVINCHLGPSVYLFSYHCKSL